MSHEGMEPGLDTIIDLLDRIAATPERIEDRGRCAETGTVGEQGPAKVSLRCGLPHGHQGVHRAGAWKWDPLDRVRSAHNDGEGHTP
jgi:hypothetical protein